MIRVLDANTLIHLRLNRCVVTAKACCLVPEAIKDEFVDSTFSRNWFERGAFIGRRFDEAAFLSKFAAYINEYPKVSFYNMKGFGDVAILATLRLLVDERRELELPFTDDANSIVLVGDDKDLRKFTKKEFAGRVRLETAIELEALLK